MILKNEKTKVVTFFGPRKIDFRIDIYLKLQNVIEELLMKEVDKFVIDSRGDFCDMAIRICHQMRNYYYGFEIERVIYEFAPIVDNIDGTKVKNYYPDVSYFLSDANRGIATNRKLIDMSDIIVVCFDTKKLSNEFNDVCSYATLNGRTLINIFDHKPHVVGKK